MDMKVDISNTCRAWFDHAANDVRAAMEGAWRKHGAPTKDPVRGSTNLAEELGEVASEALDATRAGVNVHDIEHALIMMRYELMQVAGYAILLAVQLEGEVKEIVYGERS